MLAVPKPLPDVRGGRDRARPVARSVLWRAHGRAKRKGVFGFSIQRRRSPRRNYCSSVRGPNGPRSFECSGPGFGNEPRGSIQARPFATFIGRLGTLWDAQAFERGAARIPAR